MLGLINIFIPLFIQVLVLYFLSRLINKLVLRRLGRGWYLATMWPGVVIHEMSHAVGCLLTFTKIHKINLFKPEGETLGSVEHANTKNPISRIIISTAPLFGVTGVMWALTILFFNDFYNVQVGGLEIALDSFTSFKSFFSFSGDYFMHYWNFLKELIVTIDFSNWWTYIYLYLMLSLSSHAAPSKQDLKYTFSGVLLLALIFIGLFFFDQWIQVPLTWSMIQAFVWPVYLITNFLIYGIAFSLVSLIIISLVSLVYNLVKRG